MTEIRWHERDVLIVFENASKDFLLAVAHQVEAEAKPGMRVDTGFNRNSSYVVGAGENTFQSRNEGTRSTVPTATQPRTDDEIVVGFAADYAIYQELANPTLYPALVRVAQQASGIVDTVGRKHFG